MRSRWHWIGGLLLVMTLMACAHAGSTAGRPARMQTPAASPSWVEGGGISGVNGITISSDGRTLSVQAQTPSATDGTVCYRNLQSRIVDFEAKSTIIQVTADFWIAPVCSQETTRTVLVRLPKPLGRRTVNVNSSAEGSYVQDIATPGKLRFCYENHCRPLPPTCDGATIAQIAHGTDMQQPVTWTVRDCDARWLVIDMVFTGGPACDNACSALPKTSLRWFYRATPNGWQEFAATKAAGCADVRRADPSFPTTICVKLAAL